MSSIGKEIKRVRVELELTQKEFAAKCGFDQRTLSNYETGKNIPTSQRLDHIANVVGKKWKLK